MPLSSLDPELSLDGVCVNPGSSADDHEFSAARGEMSTRFLRARAVCGPERVRY
jgi:hypothetical protein